MHKSFGGNHGNSRGTLSPGGLPRLAVSRLSGIESQEAIAIEGGKITELHILSGSSFFF